MKNITLELISSPENVWIGSVYLFCSIVCSWCENVWVNITGKLAWPMMAHQTSSSTCPRSGSTLNSLIKVGVKQLQVWLIGCPQSPRTAIPYHIIHFESHLYTMIYGMNGQRDCSRLYFYIVCMRERSPINTCMQWDWNEPGGSQSRNHLNCDRLCESIQ